MTNGQLYQPAEPPVWPLLVVIALLVVIIGVGVWAMRRRWVADLREWVTVNLGEPRATRELEPVDVFAQSPRAEVLWKEVGLVVKGRGPTIRPSEHFEGKGWEGAFEAWEIRQPEISTERLLRCVERLVSYVDSPAWKCVPDRMIEKGANAVYVAFRRT